MSKIQVDFTYLYRLYQFRECHEARRSVELVWHMSNLLYCKCDRFVAAWRLGGLTGLVPEKLRLVCTCFVFPTGLPRIFLKANSCKGDAEPQRWHLLSMKVGENCGFLGPINCGIGFIFRDIDVVDPVRNHSF